MKGLIISSSKVPPRPIAAKLPGIDFKMFAPKLARRLVLPLLNIAEGKRYLDMNLYSQELISTSEYVKMEAIYAVSTMKTANALRLIHARKLRRIIGRIVWYRWRNALGPRPFS